MAISRIRGEQIRPGVLVNAHIADNAAIHESKLDVDWAAHYNQALETKKVIDFVQVDRKLVGGASEYNLSANGVLDGNAPKTTSASTAEGVITDAPYNKVIIRDSNTGEPILDAEDREVYGRMVHDGVDFKVLFFTTDGVTETPFTMPDGQEIDFQYMERFNLRTVSELFAANEKFVAGAADITAFQNIHQLAKDIYGAGYTLDRDGEGNLTVSLVEQISNEVQARQQAVQAILDDLAAQATAGKGANLIGVQDEGNRFLGGTVEAVLAEIKDALDEFKADLASTENGKGASLIGIEDAAGKFNASNVEEALQELATRTESLELGSNAEVDNAKSRDADSANGYFVQKTFQSLEERLVEIETVVDAEAKDKEDRVAALETEVQAARGSEVSLDARLDRALNEDGTLKAGRDIHKHYRARYQATGGESEVLLSQFNKPGLPNFQVGDDSLEVYINGQLQEPGLNYQEGANGDKIIFDIGDGTVLQPSDIVQIKYYVNNPE
jgi:hypothetical protein